MSLVDTQELNTIEAAEDEVFVFNTDGISPPCHGFGEEENEPEVSVKLGDKIKEKEESIDRSVAEDMEETQNLILPGTPKRTRTDDPKPQRIVKRRSDPKDVVKHPEVGKEINLETYGGKGKYIVHSKKNRRKEDYCYTLTNEEGDNVMFDLKDQSWEYTQGEGDPLSTGEII